MIRFTETFLSQLIKRQRKDIDFTSQNLYKKPVSNNSQEKYLNKKNKIYDWAYIENYCDCCGKELNFFDRRRYYGLCEICNIKLEKDLKKTPENLIRNKYKRYIFAKETTKQLEKDISSYHSTISNFIDTKRKLIIQYILEHNYCTIDDLYEMSFSDYEKLKDNIKSNKLQQEQINYNISEENEKTITKKES